MRREPVSVVLKDGACAWVGGRDGGLRGGGGDHGLYAHDARWLRRFIWRWPDDLTELRLDARGPRRVSQRLARIVARAVVDLAAARPDRRAPELIAGDARDDGPPVAYPDACRLQAWSAAAVVAMHALLVRSPGATS